MWRTQWLAKFAISVHAKDEIAWPNRRKTYYLVLCQFLDLLSFFAVALARYGLCTDVFPARPVVTIMGRWILLRRIVFLWIGWYTDSISCKNSIWWWRGDAQSHSELTKLTSISKTCSKFSISGLLHKILQQSFQGVEASWSFPPLFSLEVHSSALFLSYTSFSLFIKPHQVYRSSWIFITIPAIFSYM